MKHIVSLSLGSSRNSSTEVLKFHDILIRITHLGVDFDLDLYESVLRSYDGKCDAIAISYVPPPIYLKRKLFMHQILSRTKTIVKDTPVHFGHHLRSIFLNWSVQKAIEQGRFRVQDSNVVFVAGLSLLELARLIEPLALSCRFLDPWTHMRAPLVLDSLKSLERYLLLSSRILERVPLKQNLLGQLLEDAGEVWLKQQIRKADIIIAPSIYLQHQDLKKFTGKTLLVDFLDETLAERMRKADVQDVYYVDPRQSACEKTFNYPITEALIALHREQDSALTNEDVLEYFSSDEIDADLKHLMRGPAELPRKYAFIIHPLSRRDLFRHPVLKPLTHLPEVVARKFEAGIAKVPGVYYGTVSGTQSSLTGLRAEGIVYTLFATPREMLEADPEEIYQKILQICDDAARRGAKIIGLGAFTKIVGDAGVSIAARSPIPVTTGNSLSAAATLWAAKDACLKMGFIKPTPKGERLKATVMIVGATGSIGKACTKVLAEMFATIIIAAVNGPRLMAFQKELKLMYPDCQIRITSQPARFASQCDLIVVSTSATEGGAFGLEGVKPGCVICDVSRPLTFSAEVAMKRPDVLIIESGEIELPGDVKINCDIGLEKPVVYACLAETALLALEGRYESFTLSRNINYKKVREIYQMAKKHGAKLAEIRSPNGVITEQEIELCREHALKRLAENQDYG